MEVPDTGDPMKDFEAAVTIEKQTQAAVGATAAAPAPSAAPASPAAAPAPSAAAPASPAAKAPAGEADDLFAEFAEPPALAHEEGALDTDKMMAEMAALVSLEPASGNSLEEGIDTDKMAAEAGILHKR